MRRRTRRKRFGHGALVRTNSREGLSKYSRLVYALSRVPSRFQSSSAPAIERAVVVRTGRRFSSTPRPASDLRTPWAARLRSTTGCPTASSVRSECRRCQCVAWTVKSAKWARSRLPLEALCLISPKTTCSVPRRPPGEQRGMSRRAVSRPAPNARSGSQDGTLRASASHLLAKAGHAARACPAGVSPCREPSRSRVDALRFPAA